VVTLPASREASRTLGESEARSIVGVTVALNEPVPVPVVNPVEPSIFGI
jgi:hypothetical protein